MLPVIKGATLTVNQIWIYTWLAVISTLVLVYPLSSVGIIYTLTALVLGAIFLYKSWQLKQSAEDKQLARSLFKYSILYMMLLCTAVVIDSYYL
jgi:protoheme IX farnesyltransferase